GGFNAGQSPEEAAASTLRQLEGGLRAFKPRVRGARIDAAILAAVRKVLPDTHRLMTDANEKCDLVSAQWLLAAARDQGVLFVEEPLPATALEGFRALSRSSSTAIATGEHLPGTPASSPYLSERLVALFPPE